MADPAMIALCVILISILFAWCLIYGVRISVVMARPVENSSLAGILQNWWFCDR